MKAHGIGFSDIGKQRSRNEDAFLINDKLGLFVVSDGMGGHAAGDIAAREAVAAVERYVRGQRYLLERVRAGYVSEQILSSIAGIAVAQASRAVYKKSLSQPHLFGMGCTLTVLLVGQDMAAMAHVGDSRLYLSRGGALVQLSADHTVADEYVRQGLIRSDEKALLTHGHALCRAVGVQETVRVDEALFGLKSGDRFLLCSDGVWGYLEEPAEMSEFLDYVPAERAAESLVAFANSVGGRDNATALVVTIETGDARLDSGEWRILRSELESATTADLPPVSRIGYSSADSSPGIDFPN
jgi:serine/threonine protein phosphatase PrpC